MALNEIEVLNLLSKINSKESVLQICEDAYVGRKCKSYSDEILKRTAQAASIENTQQLEKLLRATASLAVRCLQSGWERPEQVVTGLQCEKDLTTIISVILPLWRSLALKHMIAPPKLVAFSAQVCSKSGVSDNTGNQASCILNLTLEENGKQEELSVELPKAKMTSLVADLGRVRDQLSAIAGQK